MHCRSLASSIAARGENPYQLLVPLTDAEPLSLRSSGAEDENASKVTPGTVRKSPNKRKIEQDEEDFPVPIKKIAVDGENKPAVRKVREQDDANQGKAPSDSAIRPKKRGRPNKASSSAKPET